MTRDKIREGLTAAGLIHRYDSSSYWWKEAFKLYNSEHGLSGPKAMDMGCNRCISTVQEWIKR